MDKVMGIMIDGWKDGAISIYLQPESGDKAKAENDPGYETDVKEYADSEDEGILYDNLD